MAVGRTGVFASAHMCASKTKTEIIDCTKNMGAVKKIGFGAGHAKPMELCAQRININQNPNKNTHTGEPHVSCAPGDRAAHWWQPRPLLRYATPFKAQDDIHL